MFYAHVRVIALAGEEEERECFLDALARRGTVATLREDHQAGSAIFAKKDVGDLVRIQSPTRCVLAQRASDAAQLTHELDLLAEQEENIDFAVVVGNTLASTITSFPEVYEARLGRSQSFNHHFEALAALPEWITLGSLIAAVRGGPDIQKAGAILTFTGVVRGDALALEFDVYEEQAQQRIASITRDLTAIEGVVDAKIYHKTGRLHRGEDIVYIVIAAAHREEGFAALRCAIERVKNEVPIWKKELTQQGDRWIGT